ncbi:hypothetical protein [Flavobacterium sp. U410]
MNLFQYTIYRSFNEKETNDFELIFKDLKNQIEVYKKQYDLTIKSYLAEWKDELKTSESNYKIIKSSAEKVYQENYSKNDEYAHEYAMNVSGLDHIEYHYHETVERINLKYNEFLDLFSKSTIIALYSLNESILNKITNLSSDFFNKKIKPSHFNSKDYLNAEIQYLELVIEIDISTLEKYISKLKDIQYLRNTIIHNLSVFSKIDEASKILQKYSSSLKLDNNTGYASIISSKFTKDLFDLLKEFYEELFWLIEQKQELQIIKNGLKFWLSVLDKNLTIDYLKFSSFSSSEKQIHFCINSKELNLTNCKCKIILKKSTKGSFSYINQTNNEKLTEFLEFENKSKAFYISDFFEVFNVCNKNYQIKVLIY